MKFRLVFFLKCWPQWQIFRYLTTFIKYLQIFITYCNFNIFRFACCEHIFLIHCWLSRILPIENYLVKKLLEDLLTHHISTNLSYIFYNVGQTCLFCYFFFSQDVPSLCWWILIIIILFCMSDRIKIKFTCNEISNVTSLSFWHVLFRDATSQICSFWYFSTCLNW